VDARSVRLDEGHLRCRGAVDELIHALMNVVDQDSTSRRSRDVISCRAHSPDHDRSTSARDKHVIPVPGCKHVYSGATYQSIVPNAPDDHMPRIPGKREAIAASEIYQ